MKQMFSSELIEKCKMVFGKRAKREISDEEAELYLGKLSQLGDLAFRVSSQEQETLENQEDRE